MESGDVIRSKTETAQIVATSQANLKTSLGYDEAVMSTAEITQFMESGLRTWCLILPRSLGMYWDLLRRIVQRKQG